MYVFELRNEWVQNGSRSYVLMASGQKLNRDFGIWCHVLTTRGLHSGGTCMAVLSNGKKILVF